MTMSQPLWEIRNYPIPMNIGLFMNKLLNLFRRNSATDTLEYLRHIFRNIVYYDILLYIVK